MANFRLGWWSSPALIASLVLLNLKPARSEPPLALDERLSRPATLALTPTPPVSSALPTDLGAVSHSPAAPSIPELPTDRPMVPLSPTQPGSASVAVPLVPDTAIPLPLDAASASSLAEVPLPATAQPIDPNALAAASTRAADLIPSNHSERESAGSNATLPQPILPSPSSALPSPSSALPSPSSALPSPSSALPPPSSALPPPSSPPSSALPSPSSALPPSPSPPASPSHLNTQHLKLKTPLPLPPRIGVGYTGAGHEGSDSFGRLEGFVPLRQSPGRNVTFLEGRVLLNNEVHLGANAILAHRAYSPKDNRIYGGYLAYDNRNTSHKFFQQIGLGFESLGEVWAIRTNAYIPIGDTRQQVDVSIFDTGLQVTGTRFSGHNLAFDTFRQRAEERRFEAAVFSFDIEGGGRIAKLGNQGDLRLYGGPYYYSAPAGDSVVGWRTRLVARPSKYLNLSVGVQTDGLFGTNLLFQIGAAFPSSRGKRAAEEPTLLARMGDFVERNNSIVIDQQQTTSFFQESLSLLARNPATGEPWFFNHVTLGSSNGDGTFENPFGTVAGALGTIPSDGNGIVYVAQGTNPGIPAFTIPDRVQVLSRGPVQTLPVVATLVQSQREPIFSTPITSPVQLPFSGSGNFPLVTDTVTMGSDTVLSGFTVTVEGGPALVGRNLTNATVRDNFLTSRNSTTDGIILENISGSFDLSNSSINISNPANSGISASGISGTANLAATTGSTVTNSSGAQAGILLQNSTGSINFSGLNVTSTGTPALRASSIRNASFNTSQLASTNSTTNGITLDSIDGTFALSNTTVTASNATDSGIEVTNSSGTVNLLANAGSRISGAGGSGIQITDGTGETAVSGFEIEQANTSGILAQNSRNLTLENNRISTTGDDVGGIRLSNPGGTVTIANNQIATTGNTTNATPNNANFLVDGAHGIEVDLNNASLEQATISGNTVTTQGTRAVGILTSARDGGTLSAATISDNTVTTQGNFARGIYSRARSNGGSASIASFTISGNSVSTQGDFTYSIFSHSRSNGGSASIAAASISGNTVTTQGNTAHGIYSGSRSNGGSASIAAASISGNTVTTQGNAAHGIYSSSRSAGGSASLCTTLSGNTATTQGANADAFRFERVQAAGTAILQIADTGATFPNTQANNTAIVLGGGMQFNFVDGTGDFGQVTSCP